MNQAVEKALDRKMESTQWQYYKAQRDEAAKILKDLAALKTVNKFEVEKLIERANLYFNPQITYSDTF